MESIVGPKSGVHFALTFEFVLIQKGINKHVWKLDNSI